ncbi:MAG: ISL3 family transposase [Planctomycetes bacterium]|nr:ISL3 family transposase [Planctomycetota bacterium]
MRLTTLLRRLIGVSGLIVEGSRFEGSVLVVGVRPRKRKARFAQCRRVRPGYDRLRARRWRHLGLGKLRIALEYAPRRVSCSSCNGVRVEDVPWAAHASNFTYDFEEYVAYLAQVTDKTQVTRLAGIAWSTVGAIVRRVVDRRLDPKLLDDLRCIGIDEFSYKRRHNFLTIVVDHDRQRVVWTGKGHNAAVLKRFFDELGPKRCQRIKCVTMDLSVAYISATKECLPQAQIVFDRFHIQRLASDALDEVRREQLRELRGTAEGRELFHSRFLLLKNPWNLSAMETSRLSAVQRSNEPVYRAYLLKETLASALDYRQPARAKRALTQWIAWAARSRLAPFVRTGRTIRKHLDGILAYVSERLSNGFLEGINNRVRMIAHRAFGFHDYLALSSIIFLCCSGLVLNPPLP